MNIKHCLALEVKLGLLLKATYLRKSIDGHFYGQADGKETIQKVQRRKQQLQSGKV